MRSDAHGPNHGEVSISLAAAVPAESGASFSGRESLAEDQRAKFVGKQILLRGIVVLQVRFQFPEELQLPDS